MSSVVNLLKLRINFGECCLLTCARVRVGDASAGIPPVPAVLHHPPDPLIQIILHIREIHYRVFRIFMYNGFLECLAIGEYQDLTSGNIKKCQFGGT